MPLRKTSTVDTVTSILDNVRNERVASLRPAQEQADGIRQWLSSRLHVSFQRV